MTERQTRSDLLHVLRCTAHRVERPSLPEQPALQDLELHRYRETGNRELSTGF